MAQAFITHIEEGFILADGSATVSPELVAMETALRHALWISEIARVKSVVAEVLVNLSMPFIGTAAGGDVHYRTRVAAIFGAEGRVVHLELLHCGDGGLEGDLIVDRIAQVDSVQHEINAVFPIARAVKREEALPAQRSSQPGVLRRRHRAGRQKAHVQKVASVERNLLHSLAVNDRPHVNRLRVDDGRGRRHLHHFGTGGHAQAEVLLHRTAHFQLNIIRHHVLHPRRRDGYAIVPDLQ